MSWVKSSKIQHPDDVRQALGFSGDPNGFDLLKLYERAVQMGEPYSRGDLRVAWKVANDPYYWTAFKRYQSLQTVVNAGFFDDGQEPGLVQKRADIQFLTTPLEIIRKRVVELEEQGKIHNKPLVVALTTGCFAPVHPGHLAMMEKAKAALEAKGYEVLGGYMSPSHDDYVSTKGEVARRLTAAHRTLLLSKVLDGSDWLTVDPWESRYAPTDINFTDTIQRLEHYINAHINTAVPIQIAYIFGADNVQFARTFIDKGLGVCVPRPGHEEGLQDFIEKSGLKNNPHIILADSSGLDISSSRVRNGEAASAEKLAGDSSYQELLKGEARQSSTKNGTNTYLVRDDLIWATQQWRGKVDPKVLEKALSNFREGLVRAIKDAFERSRAPGYPAHVDVVLLSVEDQIAEAEKIMEVTPEWVVNNDVITGGDHTCIGLSRLFGLSASQFYSKILVPRPGQQELKRVMGRLPKGEYAIVDDDIATGSTLRMIEDQLPEGVSFKDKIALSERAFKRVHPDREYAFWDIVDARDFLMGTKSGGLVVQLFNGSVGRAPYMLPYTSLVSRAKIPPDQEVAFTEELLNLNRRFFRDVWVDLRLKDTDLQFQALMNSVGFRGQMHMSDLTSWHEEHMHS
jgi:nicotinic acid mononucleotide adenylyltransferase